jgi:NAD(P)-dependent dehydrogenase (short-subunit alcohol dehydrogenase family)
LTPVISASESIGASQSGAGKTAIVTGASRGIGARLVSALLERGYNVVANSRGLSRSAETLTSSRVARVDGDIGVPATAAQLLDVARSRFGGLHVLVNNAGLFWRKPFTAYTVDDVRRLLATNVEGFLYVTQLAIEQMLKQNAGGSIVNITAALASHPDRGVNAAVPMLTKGGLETITRHLAMEYSAEQIRVNAVSPGTVDTPLHADVPKDLLGRSSPMGRASSVDDVSDAVMFLLEAPTITGSVLFVDGGAHIGRW